MGKTTVRALGYIRVSTATQVQDGAGLDIQRAAIEKLAKQQGWQLVGVIEDGGVTGKIEERPGLVEVEEALRAKRADAVVVHRYDRLARELWVQEYLIAQWTAAGAAVVSVLEGEAAEDPARKMLRQILGAVAGYDRAMVVARLKWGRQAKAKRGGYAGGAVALGYKVEEGLLVVDEEAAKAVRRAAKLRRDGLGYRAIASTLAAEGFSTKRGGAWQANTVRSLLQSAQVQGRISYGAQVRGQHKALIAGTK